MAEFREFKSEMGLITIRRAAVNAIVKLDESAKFDNGEYSTVIFFGSQVRYVASDYDVVCAWVTSE